MQDGAQSNTNFSAPDKASLVSWSHIKYRVSQLVFAYADCGLSIRSKSAESQPESRTSCGSL